MLFVLLPFGRQNKVSMGKRSTFCVLHLSVDLVDKHFALMILIGECEKRRV